MEYFDHSGYLHLCKISHAHLGESGSMQSCKGAALARFNHYLATLRWEPVETHFTLRLFNADKTDVRYRALPVSAVQDLDVETYRHQDGTPIYDAIKRTLSLARQEAPAFHSWILFRKRWNGGVVWMTWDTPLLDDSTAVGYEHRRWLVHPDQSGDPTLPARAERWRRRFSVRCATQRGEWRVMETAENWKSER